MTQAELPDRTEEARLHSVQVKFKTRQKQPMPLQVGKRFLLGAGPWEGPRGRLGLSLGEKPPTRAPVSVPSSLVCETLINFFFSKSEIVLSSKNGSREAREAQEHQPAGKDPRGLHPPRLRAEASPGAHPAAPMKPHGRRGPPTWTRHRLSQTGPSSSHV